MDVQFSGMELNDEQTTMVNDFIDRLDRANHVELLNINIKDHEKAGGRTSYTTQLRAEEKDSLLTAEETDWDFHASVKHAFSKITKEVKRLKKEREIQSRPRS